MKVLVVRLSSMGDVVQTLPAIEDACRAIPNITFDWVVEEEFADIPHWHPRVERVISASLRRWKKEAAAALRGNEMGRLLKSIRSEKYDAVIDLQGEMKSAMLTRLARGVRMGYDSRSAHEWGAQTAYRRRMRVAKGQHSITRMRSLMAMALGYEIPTTPAEYGVDRSRLPAAPVDLPERFVVFVHSTSWSSKNWHEDRWRQLVLIAKDAGYTPVLPWGSRAESERSYRIAGEEGIVLPDLTIAQKAAIITRASSVIGLDTGLSHIAAAFGVPGVSLYGATDPQLVGATGQNQVNIASTFECRFCHEKTCFYPGEPKPVCFTSIEPRVVWEHVRQLLAA